MIKFLRPTHLMGDEFAPLLAWLIRQYDVVNHVNHCGRIYAKCGIRGTNLTQFEYRQFDVRYDNLSYTVEEITEMDFIKAFPNTGAF